VLVGVNLLREGLDIPECSLVAILDADIQGFLRSETSLVQTIGRAARNVNGEAVLYADRVSDAMKAAIELTKRRRAKQEAYNTEHGITPKSVKSTIRDLLAQHNVRQAAGRKSSRRQNAGVVLEGLEGLSVAGLEARMIECELKMQAAAAALLFEEAARLRDELQALASHALTLT
jgi:excinuclease ABC subunit B